MIEAEGKFQVKTCCALTFHQLYEKGNGTQKIRQLICNGNFGCGNVWEHYGNEMIDSGGWTLVGNEPDDGRRKVPMENPRWRDVVERIEKMEKQLETKKIETQPKLKKNEIPEVAI